jgi:hypothetical protein
MENVSDLVTDRSASRLTAQHEIYTLVLQVLGQEMRLRGLPAALGTF